MVFSPVLVNEPGLTRIENRPDASVQLAATLVPATLLGSNPPTILLSVTSKIVIRVALPKPEMALRPSNLGVAVVTIPELLTLLGSILTVLGKTRGTRLMANEPRPNVEASIRSGSGVAVGLAAVRLWEPLAVAFAESVMLPVELETVMIVVPAGMPVPTTLSPAISPVRLLTPVTDSD